MRYVKVLLLAILFFLALVFFFQNQNALSQNLVLTLNLFFLPPMASIPLPFYFLIVAAFFVGAVLALAFLVWDKVNLSARLMKSKWRVSSLEREMEKLRKQLGRGNLAQLVFAQDAKYFAQCRQVRRGKQAHSRAQCSARRRSGS